MSKFSDFYENKIIDHMLRNQSYTVPANVYVALFTAITGLETNNPTAEVSGNAYARQGITLNAAVGGATSNSGDISFPAATPGSWGLISYVALVDHVSNTTGGTNGNILMWGQLDTAKQIDANDTLRINSGDLDITID